MRKILLDANGDEIRLDVEYDTTLSEIANREQKARQGKGFSKGHLGFGGNLRHVASIPIDDLMRLSAEGSELAAWALAGDDKAMRTLLRQHPEWRTSEGGV